MKKDFSRVRAEIDGTTATIWLNHPEVLNACSPEMLEGLQEALDFVSDPAQGVRCLMLTGEGRAFCAGANLQGRGSSSKGSGGMRRPGDMLEGMYHPILRKFRNLDFPLVTAVNGPAAGVGMSFALMGDMILAARSAYFLQAFRRIGLVPDGGSTWLLPRLVGWARAKELALMGEKLPAEKAYEWGLVNRLCADNALMGEAKTLADELAAGPTVALGLIRKAFWESPDNSYEQQIALESASQNRAAMASDSMEGITAFVEKRPAKFTGK